MRFIHLFLINVISLLPAKAEMLIPDPTFCTFQSNKQDTTEIDRLNNLNVSLLMNEPGKMLMYADSAINLSVNINDSLRLAQSYNRKGVAYHFLGDENKALQFIFKSLTIKESLKKQDLLMPEYNNIGMVLKSLEQNQEALRYYNMAMEISNKNKDKWTEAKIWNNIGTIYRQLKQYKEAENAYEKALDLNEKFGNIESYVIALNNLGNLYKETLKFSKSIAFYNKAYETIKTTGNYYMQGLILNNIIEVYIINNQPSEAAKILEQATNLTDKVGSATLKILNLQLWAEYYEKKKNYESALDYRKKFELLNDSVSAKEKKSMYEQLKILTELEQKVTELDLLKTINTIQKKQLANQRLIQIGVLLFSALLLVTLILLTKYIKTKNKLNNSLQILVKEKTSELEKAKVQAEKSDRLKTAFLSNISHEVRTPMNAIVGFSTLIMNQYLSDDERNQFLHLINSNTFRLLKLFENVTLLSKFEQHDVLIKNEPIDPWLITSIYIKKLKENPQITNHICDIKNLIPEHIKISTDKIIFEMIIEELIDNAVKYSKEGDIIISAALNNNTFQLSVKDNGIGISKENLPNVFDKFTKFNSSLIQGYDGPGIGLSIVKHGIEIINGNIIIDSEINKGTCIMLSIPV